MRLYLSKELTVEIYKYIEHQKTGTTFANYQEREG